MALYQGDSDASFRNRMHVTEEPVPSTQVGAWLHDDSFGWRGRIGTINPSTSITVEHEWPRMLPKGTTFHVTRLPVEGATPESLDRMAQEAPRAARLLSASRVDVLCYGCTVGSLHRGRAGEDALIAALEAVVTVPVLTMARSVVGAMTSLGIAKIAVASPYTPAVNALVVRYLEESGFVVKKVVAEPVGESWKIAELTPAEVGVIARRAVQEAGDIDGLFLSCGNMRSVDLIRVIEGETRCPVVSSNQAMLWAALKAIGVREPIQSFGTLLDRQR